jgi:RNA polymerase sigma factor (sigma-70 family)
METSNMPPLTDTQPEEPQSLSLANVALRCQSETARFYKRRADHDPHYCFELFRRAIQDRDQRAWEYICAQYERQVTRWVLKHPAFASTGEEAQDFVYEAFTKMWRAVTPDRFSEFPTLSRLLRYLQMCASGAIVDSVRANAKAGIDAQSGELAGEFHPGSQRTADRALDQVQRETFWKAIGRRLRTEKERHVVYGSFVLGLPPRDVYALYTDVFHDVNEVRRTKENVLARLRRDDTLEDLYGPPSW